MHRFIHISAVSIFATSLTACSAFSPAPQKSVQYTGQGHYAAQGQYANPAYAQTPSHYNPAQYNPAQYNPAQYNPAQYNPAQYGQVNHSIQNTQRNNYGGAYSGQANQVPALRGAQVGPKFRGYVYGTLGLVNYDTSIDNYGIEGRVGYQATKHFGAEVEGSFSVANDDETFTDPQNINNQITSATGFNHSVAAFAVARLPVTNRIALHARGGYDFRSFDIDLEDSLGNEANFGDNLDGFAYGLGGEYALSERNRIRVDYTIYETDIGDADAISLSYKTKF